MKLAVLGAGDVGGGVLELAGEYGHEVVAVADSTTAAVDEDGLDAAAVLSRKRNRGGVGSGDVEAALSADYDVLVEATPTTLGDADLGVPLGDRALVGEHDVSVPLQPAPDV